MKKYNNAFKGIPVTTSMSMHQELCNPNNKSLSGAKSWMIKSHTVEHNKDTHLSHHKSDYNIPVIPSPTPSPSESSGNNWFFGIKQPPLTPTKPPLDHHLHTNSHTNHEPVVLYYCMCAVSKVPATLYITTSTISIEYNTYIGSWVQYAGGVSAGEAVTIAKSGKEIYYLKSLQDMTMTTLGSLNAIHMSFVFEATAEEPRSSRELIVSPAVMDCGRLKAIIVEVKRKFGV